MRSHENQRFNSNSSISDRPIYIHISHMRPLPLPLPCSGSSIDVSPSHRNLPLELVASVGRSTFFKSASHQDLTSVGNGEYDNGERKEGSDDHVDGGE